MNVDLMRENVYINGISYYCVIFTIETERYILIGLLLASEANKSDKQSSSHSLKLTGVHFFIADFIFSCFLWNFLMVELGVRDSVCVEKGWCKEIREIKKWQINSVL